MVLKLGSTSWVIADALRKNWIEDGRPDEKPTVVSLEDSPDWYSRARSALPKPLAEFVDLRQANRVYDHYCFIFGVRYENIPDFPYELMWVDGPVARYTEKDFDWSDTEYEHTSILDLIRVLQRRDLRLTVLIDNLKRTQIAYACLFGPQKITTFPYWSDIGVMENVSKEDLIANTTSYIPIFSRLVPRAKGWHSPTFFNSK